MCDDGGMTALTMAAARGCLPLVRLLLPVTQPGSGRLEGVEWSEEAVVAAAKRTLAQLKVKAGAAAGGRGRGGRKPLKVKAGAAAQGGREGELEWVAAPVFSNASHLHLLAAQAGWARPRSRYPQAEQAGRSLPSRNRQSPMRPRQRSASGKETRWAGQE